MATVYSLCDQVLVWLGNCYTDRHQPVRLLGRGDDAKALEEYAADFTKNPEDLDYAFHLACFCYLLKDAGKKVHLAKYALPPFWGVDNSKVLARYGIPATSEEFRNVYANRMYYIARYLGESPWATRLWTLQEFATASNVTLCFETAAEAREGLAHVKELSRDIDDHSVQLEGFRVAHHIMSTQAKALAERRKRTLFDECVEFRDLEATVPLDKLFAIIFFMAFLGMRLPMEIDYGRDTRDVIIQVSADHILASSGGSGFEPLAPLRFSREKNKYPDLPSGSSTAMNVTEAPLRPLCTSAEIASLMLHYTLST
ncbi:hypothetical protein B0T24DRAFT_722710 [Lasiosphaeria ovina]|uniref:Uncharacterized protein n=1 Tax=Lasiosphaeria ovina TaxID=92902 RepID=A0AAE0JYP3_9PEZI|nr:hypothetical protein B0T24DRAFT_722710 [Lasiosphaeria ovina]